MYTVDLDELYHVCWRPQSVSMHPLPNPLPAAPTPHESALNHVATTTPKKPAGAYRPPHARNTATPLHFKREDEGGAAHIYANGSSGLGNGANGKFGQGRRREVPGAAASERLVPGAAPGGGVSLAGTGAGADEENLSKTAMKNKKKREAAKKAKAEQQQGDTNIPQGPMADREGRNGGGRHPHQHHTRSKSRNNQHEGHRRSKSKNGEGNQSNYHAQHRSGADSLAPPSDTPSTPEPQASEATPITQDKKLRGLHKKLRAIEDLKTRLASGEKLEDTQLKKIKTEGQVRRELAALGIS